MSTEARPDRAYADALEGLAFSEDELQAFEAAAKAANMSTQDWIYTRLKACLAEEQKQLKDKGEDQP